MALEITVTKAGAQPTSPAEVNANLIATVESVVPGYTADLPGSLIEDISSTDTYAIVQCDQAAVDTINSLTPYGANDFLLAEQGEMLGLTPGTPTNTSVNVQFTGTPGFVVPKGFLVSDGTYQYAIQDGGVVAANGLSPLLFAVATIGGSWGVPAGTVTAIITSVPSIITLSVTNPQAGIPAISGETSGSYRARVLQANLAASQGMSRFLKTLLGQVSGVQQRLISLLQQTSGGWEIIVGGGDPFEVAYAIFTALFDVSTLVESVFNIESISQATQAVITTVLNHGYVAGQVCKVTDAQGMTEINNNLLTVQAVIDEKNFSVNANSTSYGAYTGGGILTPNLRNQEITLQDYPNVYLIRFVVPPQQSVAVTATWNTSATNFVSSSAIAQAAQPALVDYINSIFVGQPINLFELQSVFQAAVADILPPALLTRMVFAVSINGIGVSPESGTGIIAGDPESYFMTDSTLVTVLQG